MRQSAPPLKAGDLVGVVAASSAYDDLQPLAAGLELLRSWGLRANDQFIPERRWGYLAGTDQERIADLQCQPSPALLACARGGWGAARLLEHPIQWNPGWLLGFSDIFQNQDRPCEIRHVRAAEQMRRHGQIGGDQRPFGRTLSPGLALQVCQWFPEQQRP